MRKKVVVKVRIVQPATTKNADLARIVHAAANAAIAQKPRVAAANVQPSRLING